MRYCCLVHLNLSRYRFSSNQLKPLCSIIVLFWTFCDCKDICKDPTVQTNEEVIFESDAYKYVSNQSCSNTHIQSHFYHYSQIIRLNQTLPVDDRKFEKLVTQKVSSLHFAIEVLICMFLYMFRKLIRNSPFNFTVLTWAKSIYTLMVR